MPLEGITPCGRRPAGLSGWERHCRGRDRTGRMTAPSGCPHAAAAGHSGSDVTEDPAGGRSDKKNWGPHQSYSQMRDSGRPTGCT